MRKFTLAAAPAAEPVSTADLRTHLNVAGTAQDAYIAALGTAARQAAEDFTNRAFITQTWDLHLDAFPPGTEIALAKPPLQSVSDVTYVDAAGSTGTLAAAAYHVDAKSQPPRVVLDESASWPETASRPNAVRVRFVSGYGAAGTAVPEALRHAIKMIAAHLYEHRGDAEPAGLAEMPKAAEHLMHPWRAY